MKVKIYFMQFNHQTFSGFVRKWDFGARLVAQWIGYACSKVPHGVALCPTLGDLLDGLREGVL